MTDVQAAGARLRNELSKPPSQQHRDVVRDCRRTLADAWLAEHDPTPISNDGLVSLGFEHLAETPDQELRWGPLETYPEFRDREGNRRWFVVQGNHGSGIPHLLKPKNLGDVRRIMAMVTEGGK